MKRIVSVLALAGAIAACSGPTDADADGDGVVSSEEMADVAGEVIKPKAGQYRSTTKLISVEIPGAPPEVAEMMKGGMADQVTETCMSQEDADKGFEELAKGPQNGECETSKFNVNGGDISAEMTCNVPGQGEMVMTLNGTGTETSMDMTMSMESEMAGMGEMKMTMNIASERIGDCPAG